MIRTRDPETGQVLVVEEDNDLTKLPDHLLHKKLYELTDEIEAVPLEEQREQIEAEISRRNEERLAKEEAFRAEHEAARQEHAVLQDEFVAKMLELVEIGRQTHDAYLRSGKTGVPLRMRLAELAPSTGDGDEKSVRAFERWQEARPARDAVYWLRDRISVLNF
jgi:hypothetical protein